MYMPENIVDITPDKSLIKKLGNVGYKISEAISELIENSIDARLEGEKLTISMVIKYSDGSISIEDNGSGMDFNTLKEAMTLAKSKKDLGKELGEFGLGLKTACSSLGKTFHIFTKKADNTNEYSCIYDEDKWIKSTEFNWNKFPIFTNQVDGRSSHYTKIIIEKLKIKLYPSLTRVMRENFGKRYSSYIKKKIIEIDVNGRACEAISVELEEGTKKDIDIPLPSGKKITGWVGIKKHASMIGYYGLDLYKHKRLIKSNDKTFFQQHPTVARLVGEIHLDHVPVNFSKTNFLRDSEEFKEVNHFFPRSKKIREIVKTARIPKYKTEFSEQTRIKILEYIQSVFNVYPKIGKGEYKFEFSKAEIEPKQLAEYETTINNKKFYIEIWLVGLPNHRPKKVSIDNDRLKIEINLRSPYFSFSKNKTLLIHIQIIEALASVASMLDDPLIEQLQNERDDLIVASLSDLEKEESLSGERSEKYEKFQSNEDYIPDELIDIYNILVDNITTDFYFTATSVLGQFLTHLTTVQFYFIYCEGGSSERIYDLLKDNAKNFIILQNPRKDEILKFADTHKNKFIILREKSRDKQEIREGHVASIETAILDLMYEIKKEDAPIMSNEINEIYDQIVEFEELNENKLLLYARRRGLEEELKKLLSDEV